MRARMTTAAAIVLLGVATASAVQETPAHPPAPEPDTKPAPAGQDAAKRSKALEDLLRRLATQPDSRRVALPGARTAAGGGGETAAAQPQSEQRTVRVTRHSDLVQVVHLGIQRDLAYWDKVVEMVPGDEVRQGGKAVTVFDYPDGANYRFEGPATIRVTSDGLANPRLLEVDSLARFALFTFGKSEIDTVITLPGGNELAGRDARVSVNDLDLRAVEIRNTGPDPVVLRSPYLGATLLTVAAGQRVVLPVIPEPSAFIPHLSHDATAGDAERGRLVVEAQPEIGLRVAGDSVELRGDGPVTAIARACGARLVLRPGETLTLTRVPLGDARRKESEH
jgi:hypothetical protein